MLREEGAFLLIVHDYSISSSSGHLSLRTVPNWRPRRLGGGLGGRKAKRSARQILEDEKKAREEFSSGVRSSYAAPPPSSLSRDSFRSDRDSSQRGERRDDPPRSRGGLGYSGGADSHYGPRGEDRDRRPERRRSRSPVRGDRERRRSRSRERDSRRKRSRSPVREDINKSQRRY